MDKKSFSLVALLVALVAIGCLRRSKDNTQPAAAPAAGATTGSDQGSASGSGQGADATASARPDNKGSDPDWYKGGLNFVSAALQDASGSTTEITPADLPYQACTFVTPTGSFGSASATPFLYWRFASQNPAGTDNNSMDIYLATTQLPQDGSSWNFDAQSATASPGQVISYTRQEGVFQSSVQGSSCVLKISRTQIIQGSGYVQDPVTKKNAELYKFYIAGVLDCQLAPMTSGSSKGMLRFNANLGCNGQLFKPI